MKKATHYYLTRLVRAHGTYSHAARAIGITPRYLRRLRNEDMPPSCNRMLITEGKLVLFRRLLCELRSSGAVTTAALSEAWAALRADSSAQENSPRPHALPHSSSSTPPQW